MWKNSSTQIRNKAMRWIYSKDWTSKRKKKYSLAPMSSNKKSNFTARSVCDIQSDPRPFGNTFTPHKGHYFKRKRLFTCIAGIFCRMSSFCAKMTQKNPKFSSEYGHFCVKMGIFAWNWSFLSEVFHFCAKKTFSFYVRDIEQRRSLLNAKGFMEHH